MLINGRRLVPSVISGGDEILFYSSEISEGVDAYADYVHRAVSVLDDNNRYHQSNNSDKKEVTAVPDQSVRQLLSKLIRD